MIGLLKKYGVDDGLVLELGCGTGNMTRLLAEAGYDMIGIDLSEDMLMEAMAKTDEEQQGILYLNQDMRSFELYGTVRAIVSICDSMIIFWRKKTCLIFLGWPIIILIRRCVYF